MSVRLIPDAPVVAAWGGTMEETGWGPWQYPSLYRTARGILLSCSAGEDSPASYGLEDHWFLSADEGAGWQSATPELAGESGLRLRDRRLLRAPSRATTPAPACGLPKPVAVHPVHGEIYRLDELPDSCISKDWVFYRTEPSGAVTRLSCPVPIPGAAVSCRRGQLVTPFPCGHLRLAPDGSVWLTHYAIGLSPENGGYSPYYHLYFLRSTNAGERWELLSWLPYVPDIRRFSGAFTQAEGLCEADVVFPPDGSAVSLIRTGSVAPSLLTRSTDGGRTWSEPSLFDRCGVWPTLLTLDCGVTVAGYGRPGFFLRVTEDPAALRWEPPVALLPYADRSGLANDPPPCPGDDWQFGTCSYCDLLPLSADSFLVAYSDFYHPDASGHKRKVILTRRVRVVRD